MRRRVSAISCAALVAAALLSGCGGGHGVHTPSIGALPQSPSPSSTSSTRTAKPSPPAGAYWSYEKLVAQLAGRTVALPRGAVHLQSALLECNGNGTPVTTGTTRRWSRYTCTQTIFRDGGDHDVTFDVVILSATLLKVSAPRNGPD